MIEGISHITFIVRDLEKTTRLFHNIFNARQVYSSGNQTFSIAPEKFFIIGGVWIAVMEGEAAERSYNHVAFKIPEDEFDSYANRIEKAGIEVKPPRQRVEGEGRSLYFYDYDNHLFELHTGTLEQRLVRYENKMPEAAFS